MSSYQNILYNTFCSQYLGKSLSIEFYDPIRNTAITEIGTILEVIPIASIISLADSSENPFIEHYPDKIIFSFEKSEEYINIFVANILNIN